MRRGAVKEEDAETKIVDFVARMNEKGKGIPTRIAEIEDFPVFSYDELLASVQAGVCNISKFSINYEPDIFNAIAVPHEKFLFNFALVLQYLGPITAIILAYVYSWWVLLAVPVLFIIGMKQGKNAYLRALFRSAFTSEAIFCFLFYYKQVDVYSKLTDKIYYWGMEKKGAS